MVYEALPAAFPSASTMHAKDHPEVPLLTPVLDTWSVSPTLLAPCAEQPWQWWPADAHDELQRAKWAAWLQAEARKSWATTAQFGSTGPAAPWSSWANAHQWPPYGQPASPPAAGAAGAAPAGAEAPWQGEDQAGNEEEAELEVLLRNLLRPSPAAALAGGDSAAAHGARQPRSEEAASCSSGSDGSPAFGGRRLGGDEGAFGVAPPTTGLQGGEQGADDTTEDEAISHEIASAVHLFLSGADGEDAGEAADAGGAAADHAEGRARVCGGGSGLPAPPAERAGELAPLTERAGNCPGTPWPKGVQDFFRVIQQRPLHPLITEDVLPDVRAVFFETILSLYQDRIRPVLCLVQRRLRETLPQSRARDVLGQGSQLTAVPEQDFVGALIQAVLPVCARDSRYNIVPPMRGQPPVILFKDEPWWFQGWLDLRRRLELLVWNS